MFKVFKRRRLIGYLDEKGLFQPVVMQDTPPPTLHCDRKDKSSIASGEGILRKSASRRNGVSVRAIAVLSIVLGFILLGLCLSQWNGHTSSNLTQGLPAFKRWDKSTLQSLNQESSLNDTARTGIEGVAGLFWLGAGGCLWRKSVAAGMGQGAGKPQWPPRR